MSLSAQDRDLLIRLDTRMGNMEECIERIETDIADRCVSQAEFKPIKAVVYGLVGAILLSFVGALIHSIGM